ncbi:MAG: terminase gpA endonuclease subunit [Acidaminococcaceae bacterium]
MEKMTSLKRTINLYKNIVKKSLAPISKITVSEWADKYRMLSSEASAEPGRWKTSRAPYQKAIMDACTSPGIHKVVSKLASQTGKSDMMNNVIGRFAQVDPGPIMMIQPTIELAEDYSKSRIAPMIRDTKSLRKKFFDVKTKNSNNTILSKLYPGGRLIMCGANSPAGLASRPIRLLLCDEVDRFADSAGTEGDPVDLASKRTTTFWNYVIWLSSTPGLKGHSRIDSEYMAGTQEVWMHECPMCHEYSLIVFEQMEVDFKELKNEDGTKTVLVKKVMWHCPNCGYGFDEQTMRAQPQKYIMQNPAALKNGVRSFFVNCFTSPWLSWQTPIKEYLEAKGDPEREKVIVNTRFAESYEVKSEFDENEYLQRRETYDAEIPTGVLMLTAAVDVQDNRLEYEICGWGFGEECWGIKKGLIIGVPDTKAVWDELDMILDAEYSHANGRKMLITRTAIDTGGHYTQDVYKYCANNYRKQRIGIKGLGGDGIPLVYKLGKAKDYNLPFLILGVDSGKQSIMQRLSIDQVGPKYFHFPLDAEGIKRGYDDPYFKGLLSEKQVARSVKGKIVMVWTNLAPDKRNEPLDLRVYNLAIMQSCNPKWEKLAAMINEEQNIPKNPEKKRTWGAIKKGGY